MLYPNFSRRTLALILSCLVITLGGVGLVFLVYIFNETSSLLSAPLEKISHSYQPYKQTVIKDDEHSLERRFRNQTAQGFDGLVNKRTNLHKNKSTFFSRPSETRIVLSAAAAAAASSSKVENKSKILPINFSTKPTEVHQDTIYIDDFDRQTYRQEGTNDIDNINYFDVILVDHKVDKKENVPDHAMRDEDISFEANSNGSERGKHSQGNGAANEILTDNKSNVFGTAKDTRNKSSEGSSNLSDADSAGSGSGDFTDDTEESNEINARKAYDYSNANKKFTQRRVIKKTKRRRKQRYQLFEDYSKSSSFHTRLATKPHAGNNYVNGMVNRKDSANLSSQTFPKEADVPHAHDRDGLSRYDLFSNDNYPNLSIFQYNNDLPDHVLRPSEISSTVNEQAVSASAGKQKDNDIGENDESWIETRTRRIMGNVKKSEERSRQLLLCEEAGGGELCRMLFKEHVNN